MGRIIMRKYFYSLLVCWYVVLIPIIVLAVNPADLVRLKEAGVSNHVITEVISSNAVDRAIISVDEIIAMKAAEMPDEAIIKLIQEANPPVAELDGEDAQGRALAREKRREEVKLDLLKKQLAVSLDYLSKLITNPEIIKLVNNGKISSEDYVAIVKHLKQYAGGEDSVDYREDRHIDMGVKKRVYDTSGQTKRSENYNPHIYIVKERD
jgi:hypothetical protein